MKTNASQKTEEVNFQKGRKFKANETKVGSSKCGNKEKRLADRNTEMHDTNILGEVEMGIGEKKGSLVVKQDRKSSFT